MRFDLARDGDPDQLGRIVQPAGEGLCPMDVLGERTGRDKGAPHAIVDKEEILVLMEDGMTCSREAESARTEPDRSRAEHSVFK